MTPTSNELLTTIQDQEKGYRAERLGVSVDIKLEVVIVALFKNISCYLTGFFLIAKGKPRSFLHRKKIFSHVTTVKVEKGKEDKFVFYFGLFPEKSFLFLNCDLWETICYRRYIF